MSIENNKLMNLADGKVLYDDLRGRIEDNIVVQDEAPTSDSTKIWLPETPPASVQVPSYEEFLGVSGDLEQKVDKSALDGAGITEKTYTTKFGGEHTVTTASGDDYISPYYIFMDNYQSMPKEYLYQVTFDGTEYTLPCRSWSLYNSEAKKDGRSFEYVGNLALFQLDVSGVPEGTYNVPFCVMATYIGSDDSTHGIVLLTQIAGEHTFIVKQVTNTQTKIPDGLIYGNYYLPIKTFGNAGSSYNGFSIGINELKSKRGTVGLGFHNTLSSDFAYANGLKNSVAGNTGHAIGIANDISGTNGKAIGTGNIVSGSDSVAIGAYLVANGSSMVAMGTHNCQANTTFPSFAKNTSYNRGDIVTGKWLSIMPEMTWLCSQSHTSPNSNYLSEDLNGQGISYWALAPSTGDTLFVVGNGNTVTPSNAMKVDAVGNAFFNGNVYSNCDADSTGGTMLPKDIQINGTSIINNGIANFPLASNDALGVVKTVNNYGIFTTDGIMKIDGATDAQIKGGNSAYRPIVPSKQHQAVFYGLAKAAGDTTQASSENTVGTYTTEAKAAIHTMLGIDPASIAAQVDIPLVETVSGTTPIITGQPNVRYVCGEISTLTITPPASGSVDIIFESGSTPTTLTVPNTVKWPVWFDATALEAETTYEILITDATYGAVMTWVT